MGNINSGSTEDPRAIPTDGWSLKTIHNKGTQWEVGSSCIDYYYFVVVA